MKRKLRPALARAHDRAWAAFSAYIRARDRGTCISCGKTGLSGAEYHAGHFHKRGKQWLRYDESNTHGQCSRDNLFRSGACEDQAAEIIRRHGMAEFERMELEKNYVKRWRVWDLDELTAHYRAKLTEVNQ